MRTPVRLNQDGRSDIRHYGECYCCSCDPDGHDPACRLCGSHGKRACALHGLPGIKCYDHREQGCAYRTAESVQSIELVGSTERW